MDFAEQHRFAEETFWLIAGTFESEGEQKATLEDYFASLKRREAFVLAWDQFFRDWDLLLCPVDPGVAPLHEEALIVDGEPVAEEQADTWGACSPVSGCPSVVIPLAQSQEGLPIGVQVIGKRWEDERLLTIAQALSELTSGFPKPPGCCEYPPSGAQGEL